MCAQCGRRAGGAGAGEDLQADSGRKMFGTRTIGEDATERGMCARIGGRRWRKMAKRICQECEPWQA